MVANGPDEMLVSGGMGPGYNPTTYKVDYRTEYARQMLWGRQTQSCQPLCACGERCSG